MTLKIGSLFSGFGGLDLAVEAFFEAETVWHCEFDAAPSKILAAHWPGVPNLGDITKVNWDEVEPVDIITGGFPCQDVSLAGSRRGLKSGTRSGLWSEFAHAIEMLRPKVVVIENVRGLLSAEGEPWTPVIHALDDAAARDSRVVALIESKRKKHKEDHAYVIRKDTELVRILRRRDATVLRFTRKRSALRRAIETVLGALAELGYDAQWEGLPASSIGATHERFRVFIIARLAENSGGVGGGRGPAESEPTRRYDATLGSDRRVAGAANTEGDSGRVAYGDSGAIIPNAYDAGRGSKRPWGSGEKIAGAPNNTDASANSEHNGFFTGEIRGGDGAAAATGRRPERISENLDGESERGHSANGEPGSVRWGKHEPTIRKWEAILGRITPIPTEIGMFGEPQLAPSFVEWMMGLPEGWVTAVPGITRTQMLRALGNGVVPQQAYRALCVMRDRAEVAA